MLVLGTCSVALLTMSVIISNAIQSASVLEGKQVHASLRRPNDGDRSDHRMVQNQRQPDATPADQGDQKVQGEGIQPTPVKDSRRILNSEIYQPDLTTAGRRLITYKRYGGRLVRYRFV